MQVIDAWRVSRRQGTHRNRVLMPAMLSSKLIKGAILKVYPGAPHGLTATRKDEVNRDLLEFVRSIK